MKELQVTVQQTPGAVQWNYEELKQQLQSEMSTYETAVYTDENIGEAKGDLAMLRKLRKSVEDRRKEIKNKCLEPYALVESQAKELVALIDKPIGLIDEKVSEYNEQQREERKNRILEYMNEKFTNLPEAVGQRLKLKCYDTKWENASTAIKDWKAAIDIAVEKCEADIAKLNENVDADFRQEAMKVYEKDLDFNKAESAYNQYLQHKIKILEAEQKRKEAEQRRLQEAQERAIKEAEAKARAEEQARIRREQEETEKAKIATEQADAEETHVIKAAVPEPVETSQTETEQTIPATPYAVLKVHGTPQQIEKVKGYARYCGATVEVLEEVHYGV